MVKFIGAARGPKRFDFFGIPHWMFDTMDNDTGTIAPTEDNRDIEIYNDKLPNFRIDHTHLKFSLCEQRQLAKAIANSIRISYLKDLHQKSKSNTMQLQNELDRIRKKDSANQLWPLQHWEQYPLNWESIAKTHVCLILFVSDFGLFFFFFFFFLSPLNQNVL